jgi:hypothetical protein
MEVTGESNKVVRAANGGNISATHTALLPTQALSEGAREAYVLPEVEESLVSVPVLSDNGYTTIFLPDDEGVKVYEHDGVQIIENSPPVLQGCRDKRGVWYVPIVDEHTASPPSNAQETAMNVYDLPSTKEVVGFLHAALGYPTKATLLTAIRKGFLSSFPALNIANVTKHFPESDETQKGHMKQTKQGVRSTKVIDKMQCSNSSQHQE